MVEAAAGDVTMPYDCTLNITARIMHVVKLLKYSFLDVCELVANQLEFKDMKDCFIKYEYYHRAQTYCFTNIFKAYTLTYVGGLRAIHS